MAHRPIRVVPAAALQEGFDTIRREAHVPTAFPPEVEAEVRAIGAPRTGARVDVPFVTVDPPGSRDLDQALHIERRGDGHRVRYAIADVAAFVAPGGPLDAEAHARGVTVYAPDEEASRCIRRPCRRASPACSRASGALRSSGPSTSTAPGTVATDVARAEVRSSRSTRTPTSPPPSPSCWRRSGSGGWRSRSPAAGCSSRPRAGGRARDGSWTVRYRVPLADRGPQRADLAPHRHGRGAADARAGTGILRTQPPPTSARWSACAARPRRARRRRGRAGCPIPTSSAASIPAPRARGADARGGGRRPRRRLHGVRRRAARRGLALRDRRRYAHATAPLRRLQDRYVSECCLAASRARRSPTGSTPGSPRCPRR